MTILQTVHSLTKYETPLVNLSPHPSLTLPYKGGKRSFLATDLVTGKSVIVKLLAFSSDFEWDDLKLFEREAQTLKSLSHSQIPAYLDYFEVNSSKYQGFALVQTYIPAQTLEQYLQTGRKFTEVEVKENEL